jgi:hypothetical protein
MDRRQYRNPTASVKVLKYVPAPRNLRRRRIIVSSTDFKAVQMEESHSRVWCVTP